MKKNKINKDNSGKKTKKIIKKRKKPCGEHYSNPRYFKEKNIKLNSQSTTY